jgi:hypothetical protein
MRYRITCKSGYVITDDEGRIMEDHVGRHYVCAPHDGWRIIGFTRRHHSAQIIGLTAAAHGADIGQGWVHDIDHGTRRMWAMPKDRRAVKVEAIAE